MLDASSDYSTSGSPYRTELSRVGQRDGDYGEPVTVSHFVKVSVPSSPLQLSVLAPPSRLSFPGPANYEKSQESLRLGRTTLTGRQN